MMKPRLQDWLLAAGLLIAFLFVYKAANEFKFPSFRRDGECVVDSQVAADGYREDQSPTEPYSRHQATASFFKDPCHEIPLPSKSEFFRYLNTVTIPCRNKTSFGGKMIRKRIDGDKFVCLDSPPYGLSQRDCIVFSFGINNEWSFDDAMDRQGCKVYAFDPTMGKPSHNRSANIKFYNIGVAGEDGTKILRGKECQVLTYKSIVQLTLTENKTIDYFKIDVEGAERPFFEEALESSPYLLKKVKQIGVEIHIGKSQVSKWLEDNWRLFQKVECLGFRLMHMSLNKPNAFTKNGTEFSCCYELVWLMDVPQASMNS